MNMDGRTGGDAKSLHCFSRDGRRRGCRSGLAGWLADQAVSGAFDERITQPESKAKSTPGQRGPRHRPPGVWTQDGESIH